jgi:glycosyltransferase involved in cell wall biosynthesis
LLSRIGYGRVATKAEAQLTQDANCTFVELRLKGQESSFANFNAARANKRVESRVGKGEASGRPLITQVARFDPWKDPLGVIAVYRMLRQDFPGLQLALVGSMAFDDPEGWNIYRKVVDETRNDPDVEYSDSALSLAGIGFFTIHGRTWPLDSALSIWARAQIQKGHE